MTTDVTTLREQALEALRAFAERDEARERIAVDVLAKVVEHFDAAVAIGEPPKKKSSKTAKKKPGAQ